MNHVIRGKKTITKHTKGNVHGYSKYKPSGVEWLGEVPEHWTIKKLKYCFFLITKKAESEDNPVALENIEGWTGRFIETESEFEGDGIAFYPDDVLFGKLRPYLAKVYMAEKSGVCIGDIFVLRPAAQLFSKYAANALRSENYIKIIDGSTYGSKMPRASWEFMGGLPFSLPPLPEQQAIAAFLDRETGRIDTLINKKKKLVELLKEKRTALISHAVTKGLDASVKMKPSGVEWLGDVPEHWEVSRFRRLVQSIRNGTSSTQVDENEGMLSVTRIETISKGEIDFDKVGFVEPFKGSENYCLKKGDLLLSHINSLSMIGNCAIYNSALPLYSGMNLLRIIPRDSSDSKWLWYFVISDGFKKILSSWAKPAINQASLTTSQIREMNIAVPPFPEQQAIASFLDRETAKISTLVSKVEMAIEKLKEYRTALISAAVTGKIDLREAV